MMDAGVFVWLDLVQLSSRSAYDACEETATVEVECRLISIRSYNNPSKKKFKHALTV